jgi:hypothetical protein
MAQDKHYSGKKAHKGAMHSSHSSHKASHAADMGVSEAEAAPWGHGEMANMPQEVIKEHYPKARVHGPGVLNDTVTGIDEAISKSESKASRFLSNQH